MNNFTELGLGKVRFLSKSKRVHNSIELLFDKYRYIKE